MPKKHRFSGEILPDHAFIAVGDLHGRADLLEQLLLGLEASPYSDMLLVFVGDYIDRGEGSAEVLRHVKALCTQGLAIAIRGNHEDMLLKFLENPAEQGPRWLRHGGLQTMASFGAPNVPQTAGEQDWVDARDALADAMGAPLIDWIYALPSFWQNGNVLVVHAGADPAQPVDMQSHTNFVWGHPRFELDDRKDGLWIVHGHTIVDNAIAEHGRISVDTGAYATSVLSAAIISQGAADFIIA